MITRPELLQAYVCRHATPHRENENIVPTVRVPYVVRMLIPVAGIWSMMHNWGEGSSVAGERSREWMKNVEQMLNDLL